jgi:hypothetical protein
LSEKFEGSYSSTKELLSVSVRIIELLSEFMTELTLIIIDGIDIVTITTSETDYLFKKN